MDPQAQAGMAAKECATCSGMEGQRCKNGQSQEGDGRGNLIEVTSLGCREERLHAYHIG